MLSSFGEHTYVYIMGALQAIKRFYDLQDFTRKAGDPNWDKMPPHFCADVMHLVQRADDCKPPDSFLLWCASGQLARAANLLWLCHDQPCTRVATPQALPPLGPRLGATACAPAGAL